MFRSERSESNCRKCCSVHMKTSAQGFLSSECSASTGGSGRNLLWLGLALVPCARHLLHPTHTTLRRKHNYILFSFINSRTCYLCNKTLHNICMIRSNHFLYIICYILVFVSQLFTCRLSWQTATPVPTWEQFRHQPAYAKEKLACRKHWQQATFLVEIPPLYGLDRQKTDWTYADLRVERAGN